MVELFGSCVPDFEVKMVDVERDAVIAHLRRISSTQVEEICTALQLVIPETKKNNKRAMVNAVARYLSSEEVEDTPDEGLELFQKLHKQMKEMLGEDEVKDEEELNGTQTVNHQDNSSSSRDLSVQKQETIPVNKPPVPAKPSIPLVSPASTSVQQQSGQVSNAVSSSAVDVRKLKIRDFKINNGAVGKDKGCIKWGSLCFQMNQGLIQGYSERDIMLGVISAMKEGSSEKTFFQLSMDDADLSHTTFIGMLRSLYNVEDSEKLMDEMKTYKQGPSTSLMTYVMEMNSFRKRIMSAIKHEECPSLTEVMVRKKFIHLLLVGLRDPTTRLELKAVLKADEDISDHELMAVVNEITACGEESELKHGNSQVGSKAVDVEEKDYCTREEGKIFAEFSKIHVTMAQQQAQFQQQQKTIENLQRQLNNNNNNNNNSNNKDNSGGGNGSGGGSSGAGRNNRRRKFMCKCAKCLQEGVYCNHCAKCGEEGHKQASCPKNE